MKLSIDTNVLATLLNPDDPMFESVADALDKVADEDLVVCGFVYAELMAAQRSELELDRFFRKMEIEVDWKLDEDVLRAAGRAFRGYVERRKNKTKGQKEEVRRMLTDFLIGAHAQTNGHALLTRDKRIYRAAFPAVPLIRLD